MGSAFRALLENTTLAVGKEAVGVSSGQVSVSDVVFKPEAFVARIPTTTTESLPPTTSTATGTVTGTDTSSATSTAKSTSTSPRPVSTMVATTSEVESTS